MFDHQDCVMHDDLPRENQVKGLGWVWGFTDG